MKIWKAVFTIWIVIWLLFIVRGFAKGEFKRFKALCRADIEQKKEYILGKGFKAFIDDCIKTIPEAGTYKIVGELDGHSRHRLIYYLYPRVESKNPDYVLNIYKEQDTYSLKRTR